jgi:hypothetical protein
MLFCVCLGGCSNPDPTAGWSSDSGAKTVQSTAPVAVLAVPDLIQDIGKYEGRVVVVKGNVLRQGKDALKISYVVLGESNNGTTFLTYSEKSIQCYFPKATEDALLGVNKGQEVSVKGKVFVRAFIGYLMDCTLQ